MPYRRPILLAVLAAVLAVPAGASAAPSVAFQRGCYLDTAVSPKANFTARGFPARSTVYVSLDGDALGTDRTNGAGMLTRSVPVPPHPGTDPESRHVLEITDGTHAATAILRATSHLATFAPTTGDPTKLKVRFSVFGMRVPSGGSTVFLHYVTPKGKLRKTVALGTPHGACGHILRSQKRRLFPFAPSDGRWTLQFDTHRTYSKGRATSPFAWASIGTWITLTTKTSVR